MSGRRSSTLTIVTDRPVPAVLSIAGSDSGGGAGIQADLKAFARCGVHGMTAIAALTAQNTVGVTGIHAVPGAFIVDELLPRVTVITPNVPEARVLAGGDGGDDDAAVLARRLHRLGPTAVVVTGGHREAATDTFFDGTTLEPIPGERHPDGAAHGSGCTHSSALAAHLALGWSMLDAARAARRIAGEAVRDGIRGLGAGAGPVDVFALTTAAERGAAPGRATSAHLA